jgi:hypothetical protein
MWDLWWTKWNWCRFFSEYFGFLCQFSFHRLFHTHHHLSSEAGTIDQKVGDEPSRFSLTPPQETKKKKKKYENEGGGMVISSGSRQEPRNFHLIVVYLKFGGLYGRWGSIVISGKAQRTSPIIFFLIFRFEKIYCTFAVVTGTS